MIKISKNGYSSNEVSRSFGSKTIKVENLTPSNVGLEEQKRKICGELFEIFEKYSAEGKNR